MRKTFTMIELMVCIVIAVIALAMIVQSVGVEGSKSSVPIAVEVVEREAEYNHITEWTDYVIYTESGERFTTSQNNYAKLVPGHRYKVTVFGDKISSVKRRE